MTGKIHTAKKQKNNYRTSDIEIKGGCGADLMSDVLASIKPDAILFTGLCNPQVVRTAQMADIAAIVLVRGKNPPPETVARLRRRRSRRFEPLWAAPALRCSQCRRKPRPRCTRARTPAPG